MGQVEGELPEKYKWLIADNPLYISNFYILNSTELDEYFSLIDNIKDKVSKEKYGKLSEKFGLHDTYMYLDSIECWLQGYISDRKYDQKQKEFDFIIISDEYNVFPVYVDVVNAAFKLFKHIRHNILLIKDYLSKLEDKSLRKSA